MPAQNSPLDKPAGDPERLEERDILAAYAEWGHLGWDLDTIEQVEAELERKSPRETRALIVAEILRQRFEMHTRYPNPTHDPGPINAYERFAGHLGIGPVE